MKPYVRGEIYTVDYRDPPTLSDLGEQIVFEGYACVGNLDRQWCVRSGRDADSMRQETRARYIGACTGPNNVGGLMFDSRIDEPMHPKFNYRRESE